MKMTNITHISISKTSFIISIIVIMIATSNEIGSNEEVYSQGSNSKAPDFNLQTIEGKQVSLESFKGKPVVLWFMSLSCPSCYAQADVVKQVKSEYGNRIDVLMIDILRDSNTDLQNFVSKFGHPDWKTTVDTDKMIVKYGITVPDSTVVLDKNGNVVFKNLGPVGYELLKDTLSKSLAATVAVQS